MSNKWVIEFLLIDRLDVERHLIKTSWEKILLRIKVGSKT